VDILGAARQRKSAAESPVQLSGCAGRLGTIIGPVGDDLGGLAFSGELVVPWRLAGPIDQNTQGST
jgi:hypothetical protein